MKEILFIILCVGLYVYGSFRLHRLLLKVGRFFFLILSAAYVVCSFYLFTTIVYVEQVLDPKGLRFNFGHDSSMLVMMLFVWMLIAFVNIIAVCARRFRKN